MLFIKYLNILGIKLIVSQLLIKFLKFLVIIDFYINISIMNNFWIRMIFIEYLIYLILLFKNLLFLFIILLLLNLFVILLFDILDD